MKRRHFAATPAAFAVMVAGLAYTAQGIEHDSAAFGTAKIGVAQVVAAAERCAGGKAFRAELEKHAGRWVFNVEVSHPTNIMIVKVDPTNGNIITCEGQDTSRPEP